MSDSRDGSAKSGERRPSTGSGNVLKWAAALGLGYFAFKEWKSLRHSERTRYGFDVEEAIAEYLDRRGADVWLSNGSRGPIDVYAEWTRRLRWGVQVKSSRDGMAKMPGPAERERLFDACCDWGARAVIALHDSGRTTYYDARTAERVMAPRR